MPGSAIMRNASSSSIGMSITETARRKFSIGMAPCCTSARTSCPGIRATGAANECGEGSGAGLTLNCPLPAGSGEREIFLAFRELLLPAIGRFHPDLILISAGFDSRVNDPLGQFTLQDSDFAALTQVLLDAAESTAHGRVISVLEGGLLGLSGLASAAEAHVRALTGTAAL